MHKTTELLRLPMSKTNYETGRQIVTKSQDKNVASDGTFKPWLCILTEQRLPKRLNTLLFSFSDNKFDVLFDS